MSITFYIYCETTTFTWENSHFVPRVGEYVKLKHPLIGEYEFIIKRVLYDDEKSVSIYLDY